MKLVFNLDGRDGAEASGASSINKEDCSGLKSPELGRLEDHATTPILLFVVPGRQEQPTR